MNLVELGTAVAERRVSAEELVRVSLERIERLDPSLGAVVRVREEAIDEARKADASRAPVGPLTGLPLLVKDNEDCAGLPTTYGSLLHADTLPARADCEEVARLKAAGAIVVGKTNLPEFAFEGFTTNRLFGDTRNPWSPEWSPGGSSGGSGVALITGMAPLATATDGGGSIRIPAAFCGLVGLKPTAGLIGRRPIPSWIDLSTNGPLARSIADARLLLDVLRGPVAGDPTAAPSWSGRADVFPKRILSTGRLIMHEEPLPAGVRASFDAALVDLERASGLPVEAIDPPLPPLLDVDWLTMVGVEELTWIGRDVIAAHAEELTSYLRVALDVAAKVGVDDYIDARRRRFEFTRAVDDLLGDTTVIVSPTMCVEGFTADGRLPGARQQGTEGFHYNTQVSNTTGHPSLSVPAGISANGVPFGLQITGPRFADDMVLALGEAWEAARPWPSVAPGFEPFGV
jgi:Asp-tRNA(Asn)/Glu-tRNA(Gln) amidotransferase A subunit family amidase